MSLLIDALGVGSIKEVWLKSIVQTTGILSYLSTDTATSQMLRCDLKILIGVEPAMSKDTCKYVLLKDTTE